MIATDSAQQLYNKMFSYLSVFTEKILKIPLFKIFRKEYIDYFSSDDWIPSQND